MQCTNGTFVGYCFDKETFCQMTDLCGLGNPQKCGEMFFVVFFLEYTMPATTTHCGSRKFDG